MAYIVGIDRNQTRMVTTSLDALIDEDNSVRVIDAYVDSLSVIIHSLLLLEPECGKEHNCLYVLHK